MRAIFGSFSITRHFFVTAGLLQAHAWPVHLILVNKPDAGGFKGASDLIQC
jgi:hypothetical protein